MIKKGDKVTIDGKTAEVIGWWGQGTTTVYQLSDGRTVFDLHLLLEDGNASLSALAAAKEEAEIKKMVEEVLEAESEPEVKVIKLGDMEAGRRATEEELEELVEELTLPTDEDWEEDGEED